jgi:hypothetical protein
MDLRARHVYDLFLLNLTLQMFDAVATYHGLKLGWREANPIIANSFQALGVGPALLLFKANACGLLLLLSRNHRHRIVVPALTFLASVYCTLSLIPWLVKFSLLFIRTIGEIG